MVYSDGIHLVADTLKELHDFAQKIGMKKGWFQDRPDHPHYDIISKKFSEGALQAGARKVSTRQIVMLRRESKGQKTK